MNRELIVEDTINFVKEKLKNAETGHDFSHILRVYNLSKTIAKDEKVNLFVVELGSLLHDIADSKFYNGDETIGPKIAREFLTSKNIDEDTILQVIAIIENISFKGGNNIQKFKSFELDVVQDADRLDAIGAIGIARTFNYGGFKGRELYNPNIKPNLNMTKDEYMKNNSSTINHFYEKLLLLKDKMNTNTGRKIALARHEFMKIYLEEFYAEWNGEK